MDTQAAVGIPAADALAVDIQVEVDSRVEGDTQGVDIPVAVGIPAADSRVEGDIRVADIAADNRPAAGTAGDNRPAGRRKLLPR